MTLTSSKISVIISLTGGVILLISGLIFMQYAQIYRIDESTIFRRINAAVTIGIGCLAIYGSIITLRGKMFGYKLLILFGILGIAGTFIPVYFYDPGWGPIQIFYLCGSAMYIDLVLITLGGILGIALKENNERA